MFAEEKPALLPLPGGTLPLLPVRRTHGASGRLRGSRSRLLRRAAGLDRARVRVQWDVRQVRLMDPLTGQLLREHLRQKRGGHRIQDQDRPQRTPLGTLATVVPRRQAGPQIGALCRAMHGEHGETTVRRIQGVLSLAKKYGTATVEEACAAALEMGVRDYRFVRRYLDAAPKLPLSLRQVDPLIRQLTLYRDFINNKNQGGRA